MVLGNECFLLDGGVRSERQPPRWKHAFYGMFSSWLILMGYALYISLVLVQFLPLICGRLLADLDSLRAETIIIYILFCFFYDCFQGPIDGSHLDMIHHMMT